MIHLKTLCLLTNIVFIPIYYTITFIFYRNNTFDYNIILMYILPNPPFEYVQRLMAQTDPQVNLVLQEYYPHPCLLFEIHYMDASLIFLPQLYREFAQK